MHSGRRYVRSQQMGCDGAGDPRKDRTSAEIWTLVRSVTRLLQILVRKVIGLNPGDVSALASRASIWSQRKDYDRAIADYTEAIRLEPSTIVYREIRAGL